MGIKNLSKILNDDAPSSVKEESLAELMGRKIAIDASMAIYQFLVAVRSSDGGGAATQLTNEAGEVTSHIQGMWNRTIRMLESGIKPAYVFDGKPPVMKGQELKKRSDAKAKAQADLKAATEAGVVEDMDKFSKRTVHMTGDHIADCKRLLQLMGVPVISAPCEAEAQCAELCKAGKVYAAASEDTDTITFGAPKVIRRLAFSEARKLPILEYDFTKVLEGLELTHPQFIDLCILCGCDYCDNIKGIGPKTALKLIRTHGDIEGVLAHIDAMPGDKCKYSVPDEFRELFAEARKLFSHADVTSGSEIDLRWTDCDEEGLKTFLVAEKGFNVDRVERGIQKIKKAKKQGSQMRMDSFFSVVPKAAQPAKRKTAGGGGKKPAAKKQKGKK